MDVLEELVSLEERGAESMVAGTGAAFYADTYHQQTPAPS